MGARRTMPTRSSAKPGRKVRQSALCRGTRTDRRVRWSWGHRRARSMELSVRRVPNGFRSEIEDRAVERRSTISVNWLARAICAVILDWMRMKRKVETINVNDTIIAKWSRESHPDQRNRTSNRVSRSICADWMWQAPWWIINAN